MAKLPSPRALFRRNSRRESASTSFWAIDPGSIEMLRTNQNPRRIVADSLPPGKSYEEPRTERVFERSKRSEHRLLRARLFNGTGRRGGNPYNISGSLGVSARRAETRPWDLIRFIPAWESEPSPLLLACPDTPKEIFLALRCRVAAKPSSFHDAFRTLV